MSDFSGIASARTPAPRNTYIQPGTHVVRVIAITTGISNTTGKLYVAVDCEVVETNSDNVDHAPGCCVSILMSQNMSFLPNIKMLAKALLEAASGAALREEDINEETIQTVLGSRPAGVNRYVSQAAAGLMVKVIGSAATSKAGSPYTRLQYVTHRA